jgi:hypothetical protein
MQVPNTIERVAEQYRREGYDVIEKPAPADRPEFAREFEIDLLARRANDQVVIAIRQRNELKDDVKVLHLAGVVNATPGWRFDLVMLSEQEWPDSIGQEARERSAGEIRDLASQARQLVTLNMLEPACLLAWSALEAAMRDAAKREGIVLDEKGPRFVLNTIVANGLMSRDDYEIARQAMQIRNSIAHGLKDRQLDQDIPLAVADIAEQLLDGEPVATS